MQRLKKILKILAAAIVLLPILLAGIYALSWHLVASNMQAQIDYYWTQKDANPDFMIEGEKPRVSGFPHPPQCTFSGVIVSRISGQDFALEIPEFKMVGFPLSGLTIYFETPQGMTVSERTSGRGVDIDYALLNVTLPRHLPQQTVYHDLLEWQKLADPLIVNNLLVHSGEVSIDGQGTVGLDNELQADVRIEARIKGMDALFDRLSQDSKVRKQDMMIARKFLKMVIRTDEETGEEYFDTGFFIQSNGIFIGPMRIGQITPIKWPGTPYKPVDYSRKSIPSEQQAPPKNTDQPAEDTGEDSSSH